MRERPGRFYHVSDVKGREKVERMCVGEQDRNRIYAYALRTVVVESYTCES